MQARCREVVGEFEAVTVLVAAYRAATRRPPLLLEASLLRFAVPQKYVAAVHADKVDVFEWESRVHWRCSGERTPRVWLAHATEL